MTKRRAHEEDDLQIAVADYLAIALPDRMGVVWFHVPNGGRRNKREAGRLKRMGVKAGVPDFCFITRPPFFIELKAEKGRLSEDQKDMIGKLRNAGAQTYICRSIEDVQNVLTGQGVELAGMV